MCVCLFACVCLHVVEKEWEKAGEKGGQKETSIEGEEEAQEKKRLNQIRDGSRSFSRRTAYVEKMCFHENMQCDTVSLITLTLSPDRGLFFGRVGKASSFGLVSMAQ